MGALIKKGFNLVVLKYGDMPDDLVREEWKSNGIEYTECSEIEELFFTAVQYNPLVYYIEPRWGDCSYPEIMIKHKKLYGKIVITLYDVLNDCRPQGYDEEQKRTEKYVLENADGIVWRWFSKEYLEEKKGFVYKGKSIQFLDCCNGVPIVNVEFPSQKLRLCCLTGGISEVTYSQNRGELAEFANLDEILGILGNREDCEFHCFFGHGSKEQKEIANLYEKKYSNFKAFWETPHDKLINEISTYDYGCFFYTNGRIPDDMEITTRQGCYGSICKNAASNKFFDYIEAELPIITTFPLQLCAIFDDYGIRVNMNISNIDIAYLIENRAMYKERVKKAKQELSIDNQIQSLIDFFEDL
jgi:hypothetical protein